jgi:glycosyltransferase involved in cell wall biosynthesis
VHAEPLTLALVAHPNSIHTRRWAAWFALAGHRVVLVDPVGIEVDPGLPDGVRVERSDGRGRWPLAALGRARRLRRTLTELSPDVVHAQYLARFGWLSALAGVRPLVVTPWGSDLLQVGRRRVRTRLWNRLALRRADLVTVSSDGMRAAAVAAGARPDRIRLVHHGVDIARFAPGEPAATFRARLDAGNAPIVVSPRTVAPLYQHEVVLAAVAEVARRQQPAPIMVVSAVAADPAALRALRDRAAADGIADRLRVLDTVGAEELPDLYRAADVVVSVPETDSFPVTLLEAMATGRPVVASDLPAVRPVLASIDPLADRLVVPVGDVAATADAIERALTLEEADRHRLGEALRAYVVANAEYDTNMAAMEAIYRDLAARRR